MAIYHLSIKIISRSTGRSAVAAATYRAGKCLHDEQTGILHDYSRKRGVVMSEILLPAFAPDNFSDRETLWNEVQRIEKNSNAQLAREIEIALPKEMHRAEQIECIREYLNKNFVDVGMCADWALHDKGDGNPHAHILLTMRQFKPDGTWDVKKKNRYILDENGNKIPVIDKKTGLQKIEKKSGRKVWERHTVDVNDWNDQSKAEEWRKAWSDHVNSYLTHEQQIDHRSYKRQGLDKEPTIHEGYIARDMENKGKVSDRCEINREIHERNRIREWIRDTVNNLTGIILKAAKIQYEKIMRFLSNQIGGSYEPDRTVGDNDRDYEPSRESYQNYRRAGERHRQPDDTDRVIEGTKRFLDSIDGGIGETKQFISGYGKRTDRIKRDASESGRKVAELEAVIKRRKEQANESIRRIYERYRNRQSDGKAGGGSEGFREEVPDTGGTEKKIWSRR